VEIHAPHVSRRRIPHDKGTSAGLAKKENELTLAPSPQTGQSPNAQELMARIPAAATEGKGRPRRAAMASGDRRARRANAAADMMR